MKFLVAICLLLAAASSEQTFLEYFDPNIPLNIFSNEETTVDGTSKQAVCCSVPPFWNADISQAKWVWTSCDPKRSETEEVHTFSNKFNTRTPYRSHLKVAASGPFTTTIDKVDVKCSSSKQSSSIKTQVFCDVTDFVKSGDNEIIITVTKKQDSGLDPKPAGLLYQLSIYY